MPEERRRSPPLWQPKIYIAVARQSYYPVLHRLLQRREDLRCDWKFYWIENDHSRGDKLVFYPHTRRRLSLLVGVLRDILGARGARVMSHAASSVEFGLEPAGARGIFVGADPNFLRYSWRLYRALVVAWEQGNRSYVESLPGGRARWFARMNLSLRHDGPRALVPPAADARYVRAMVEQIMPPPTGAAT